MRNRGEYRIYQISYNALMTNMKRKSILLLILSAFMLVLVACGGDTQPTPDIDATVEAKVAHADALDS
jgi:hypothetical protein